MTIRLPAVSVNGMTRFRDKHLARACQRSSLVQIDVAKTSITDNGMKSLLLLNQLEKLTLRETAITDESISVLVQLTTLEKLDVRGTKISNEGLGRLKAALHNTTIISE